MKKFFINKQSKKDFGDFIEAVINDAELNKPAISGMTKTLDFGGKRYAILLNVTEIEKYDPKDV